MEQTENPTGSKKAYGKSEISEMGNPGKKQGVGVSWGALALGLAATALLVAISERSAVRHMNAPIAGHHFPTGAFVVLIALTLIANIALYRRISRLALSPAQLIAVWVLVAVPAGIPSSGMMRQFVPNMVAYPYFASPAKKWEAKARLTVRTTENLWGKQFGDKIDPALLVNQEKAVQYFYEGLPHGEAIPWRAWLRPVAVWGIYAFALYAVMIGLSVLLRRRWVEYERFTFPLVQLPIELVKSPEPGRVLNSFLSNRSMWLGASVVFALHFWNGMWHYHQGLIPQIPMYNTIRFREGPLAHVVFGGNVGVIPVAIWPLMIGFAYLLTSEVSFSLWFSCVFVQLRAVLLSLFGLPMGGATWGASSWLWASLEEAGGTIALGVWFLWLARDHLRKVFQRAFTGNPAVEDSDEPLSYRASSFFLLLGTAVMVAWLAYFGGSFILAVANVLIAILVFVTLAWTVSQGGLLLIQPTFSTSLIITTLTGSRFWPMRSLLINLWNEQVFRMNLRTYLLPSLLHAYKMSDAVRLRRDSLLKSCLAAIILAFFVSLIAAIRLPYTHTGGAIGLTGSGVYVQAPRSAFRWLSGSIANPLVFDPRWVIHFVGGALFVIAIMWLRTHTNWCTLHPIGFITASGGAAAYIWFSLFLTWLIKGAIMRWGGYRLYQKLRPFFLGLVVGSCVAAAFWIIIGFAINSPHNYGLRWP